MLIRLLRSGRERITNITLQCRYKVLVALAGHHRQAVDVMYPNGIIHPITKLIDGQTQATSNLLTPGGGIVAVFECTNHKDIRVIPTFPQCRVREDKAGWLLKAQ